VDAVVEVVPSVVELRDGGPGVTSGGDESSGFSVGDGTVFRARWLSIATASFATAQRNDVSAHLGAAF
jgi:hypothetical protein